MAAGIRMLAAFLLLISYVLWRR